MTKVCKHHVVVNLSVITNKMWEELQQNSSNHIENSPAMSNPTALIMNGLASSFEMQSATFLATPPNEKIT